MSVRQLVNSIRHALRGVGIVFRTEQNFRVQVVGASIAFLLAWYYAVPTWQTIVLLLLVTLVLVLELINSAVEYFTDLIKPRFDTHARTVKDIMAGAVLVASCTAVVIGSIIFMPYFISSMK